MNSGSKDSKDDLPKSKHAQAKSTNAGAAADGKTNSSASEIESAKSIEQESGRDNWQNSDKLLLNRGSLSRLFCLLMGIESAVLLALAFFVPGAFAWYNAVAGVLLSAAVYASASSQIKNETLEEVCAGSQMIMASLVIAATGASFASHYALPLSLGLICLYRRKRVLAVALIISLVEQSLRSVFLPDTVFAVEQPDLKRSTLVTEHFAWLAASGSLLLLACPSDGKPDNAQEAQEAQLGGGHSGKPSAEKTSKSTGKQTQNFAESGELEGLLKSGSEIGVRAKRLQKSISGIDGPLRRMVQSINAANRSLQEIKDELSKTLASVIHVTQSAEIHANKANEVYKAADEAAYGSQIGALSTEQTIRNMERIREQMDSIEKRMENLLGKSQLMVKVVGIADELALQSKVLSVNAAIEAAKAGDRGQGFSAVAKEVKSLANQSKEATRQVRQILKEIQASIAEVRRSIALGNETVDQASDQCHSTSESIKVLDNSVNSSRDAAETIMNSSKDQVQGMMLISRAMNDIQMVSDQNSGSLSNLQVEAQKLNSITRELIMEMNGYQTFIDDFMAECKKLENGTMEPSPKEQAPAVNKQ